MTDEELKALVAANSLATQANTLAIQALGEKTDKDRIERARELDRQDKRIDAERKERARALDAEREARAQELDRQDKKLAAEREKRAQELDRQYDEILASRRETDRLITSLERRFDEVNRQLGGLANALGVGTEAAFYPSLERILREDYGMKEVASRVVGRFNGETMEIDILAHANDEVNKVYIAEIKATVRSDAIDQILRHLQGFPKFFPQHKGKQVFGILAGLSFPQDLRRQASKAGLYLATIRNDVFELVQPEGREPRAFPV